MILKNVILSELCFCLIEFDWYWMTIKKMTLYQLDMRSASSTCIFKIQRTLYSLSRSIYSFSALYISISSVTIALSRQNLSWMRIANSESQETWARTAKRMRQREDRCRSFLWLYWALNSSKMKLRIRREATAISCSCNSLNFSSACSTFSLCSFSSVLLSAFSSACLHCLLF